MTSRIAPDRSGPKPSGPDQDGPDAGGGARTIAWIFPGGERVPGFPGGQRVSGQIAIGVPELVPDGNGEAICPITMGGLDGPGRVTNIHGEGKFHALLLAIGFIERRTRDSVAQGFRVELPDYTGDPERDTEFLLTLFKSSDVEPR